jgi:hypothetical protein
VGAADALDLPRLLHWAVLCQVRTRHAAAVAVLCEVIGEPIKRLAQLIGEPIKLTGKRALRKALSCCEAAVLSLDGRKP